MTPDESALLMRNLPIASPMSGDFGKLSEGWPKPPAYIKAREVVAQQRKRGLPVPAGLLKQARFDEIG